MRRIVRSLFAGVSSLAIPIIFLLYVFLNPFNAISPDGTVDNDPNRAVVILLVLMPVFVIFLTIYFLIAGWLIDRYKTNNLFWHVGISLFFPFLFGLHSGYTMTIEFNFLKGIREFFQAFFILLVIFEVGSICNWILGRNMPHNTRLDLTSET